MKINTDARLPQNESLQSLKQRLYEIHREVATLLNATSDTASAAMVASSAGPCFSAYQNTPTAVPNGVVNSVIGFQVKEWDTASCFSAGRFTPSVAGWYLLSASVFDDAGGGGRRVVSILKNGTEFKRGADSETAPPLKCSTVTCLVQANGTTDYFEVGMYQSSGAVLNTTIGQATTYFQGHLARLI